MTDDHSGSDDDDRPGGGRSGGSGEPEEFDQAAFEAAFAAEFGQTIERDGPTGSEESDDDAVPAQQRRLIAVVLTPIKSAAALAGICAMLGIEAHVIPSSNGALAALTITGEVDETELLLSGAPAQAVQMAEKLSRATKAQTLLLTANLGTGDEGPTGNISGREYTAGEPGQQVPAGLILASADDVLEALLIGTLDPADAPGRLDPAKAPPLRPGGLFGSRRRKKS